MKLIKTCPFCLSDFESEGTPDSLSSEMIILKAFVREFHPFYASNVDNMTYNELTNIVKEITEEF